MFNKKSKKIDEKLSPTAKRLKDEADRRKFEQEASESRTTWGRIRAEAAIVLGFLSKIIQALMWLWWNFGNPFLNKVTIPILRKFFGWYVPLWNRFTTVKDKYGNERFSKSRGAGMVVATALAAMVAWELLLTTWDASWYVTTGHRDRVVWLANAQEIYPNSNVFSVQGCDLDPGDENLTTLVTCSERNSLYYRVAPTLFSNVWSIASWKGLFFPDKVVAPIGADWSKCIVTDYGLRFRILIFLWDIYPVLLSATCERSTSVLGR